MNAQIVAIDCKTAYRASEECKEETGSLEMPTAEWVNLELEKIHSICQVLTARSLSTAEWLRFAQFLLFL